MSTPLRWGIMGTGGIARKFAGQLPAAQRGFLAAVGSRLGESAARFAAQFGGAAYGSYDALLAASDVDAVYISLPNSLHYPWTLQALAAGKHVLCEKPLAASSAEAEEMFAAAERVGRVLAEAFMYRSHPAVRKVIELAHSGAIGEVRLIRTHFTYHRPMSTEDVRLQPQLAGGSLMDVGCYCINFARAVAGSEPTAVHAVAHLHASGVDDYAAGTLDFGGRTLAAFTCGMTVHSDRTTYIGGSDGYLAIHSPWFSDGQVTQVIGGPATGESRQILELPAPRGQYALEADDFAATVQDGAPPTVTAADSIGNMRVLDALRAQIKRKSNYPQPPNNDS